MFLFFLDPKFKSLYQYGVRECRFGLRFRRLKFEELRQRMGHLSSYLSNLVIAIRLYSLANTGFSPIHMKASVHFALSPLFFLGLRYVSSSTTMG